MWRIEKELIEQGVQQGLARGREEGREEGLKRGMEQGRLHGRAEAILRLIIVRGLSIDYISGQRILSCTDEATLDRWFDRALRASSLAEVLEDVAQ